MWIANSTERNNAMKIQAVWWLAGWFYITFGLPLSATPVNTPDTLKILAIRVAFQPDDATTTTGDGQFDLGQSSDPFQIDPPPHNRSYFQDHLRFAENYFARVSRGNLVLESEVFPQGMDAVYQLDLKMTDYNPNTSASAIDEGLARLLRDAFQKADEDPAIDFSRYNSFIVFHAGVGRDIDFGFDDTPQDIPSLFITSQFLQNNLGIDGIPVDGGATLIRNGILLPETESQEGLQLGLNGMLVSNLGSQLGWLDLFSPETRRSGVGRFGLMDAGLFNGDGLLPSLPTAWTRVAAGWETPQTIYQAQNDIYTIHSTLSDAANRVYKLPINDREYFLLENRYSGSVSLDSIQAVLIDQRNELVSMREILTTYFPDAATFSDSTGVLIDIDNPDRGLPGGGILIWHIDENIIEANRAANRINNDPEHRGVDLEEADGSQDIGAEFEFISGGAGSEIGTSLDPWYADNNAPLFEASPAGTFSLTSVPNSRSYYNRANSHIKLSGFSERDSVMSFSAEINFFQAGFPKTVDPAVYGRVTSLKTADLLNNGRDVLLLTTNRNRILALQGGNSAPGSSDTLFVLQLPEALSLITPPAIWTLSDGNRGIVALSREGDAYGYRFDRLNGTLDSLFQFRTAPITTYPVVEGGAVYWGSASGAVYRVEIDGTTASLNEYLNLPGEVRSLLFTGDDKSVIVGADDIVYRNGSEAQTVISGAYPPSGSRALALSGAGSLQELSEDGYASPEDGIHQFDGPAIAIRRAEDGAGGEAAPLSYLAAGNNQIYAFNYNLTLRDNFPVKIYNPAQSTGLFLTPLTGVFPDHRGEAADGMVVADPAGLIVGVGFDGKSLPDFPLALGDSLAASPVLADLDGDGDIELACVTIGGSVFAWDFSTVLEADVFYWRQQYATPENNNRDMPASGSGSGPSAGAALLQSAYNWPNPNIDNHTFIRYHLSEAAEVNIRIFDLAGDLVTELAGGGLGSTDNEVRWDLTSIQSGVYVARIEASGGGKNAVQLVKIAVVK